MTKVLTAIGRALVTDDVVRAYLLAYLRHILSGLGVLLVLHGYASQEMVQTAIGLVCATIAFFAAHKDVAQVSEKIKGMQDAAEAETQWQRSRDADVAVHRRLQDGTL
ncbi:MAG TPA: hypothetical protein VN154_12190 [Rhizomicrobium sp.]|nr:hypothetical protein [Rhizomicrobium sp.]